MDHSGHAHQNQHEAVSHHEGAPSVLGSQPRKAQKISQPDGTAGHSENHAYFSGPLVLLRL